MIRLILVALFLIIYCLLSIPAYLIELIIGLISKDAKVRSSQWLVCKLDLNRSFFSPASG